MPGDRPRWVLHVQAQFWRFGMSIGMLLHRMARPLPPAPSFHKYIDATVSPLKGKFRLQFYVPKDYERRKKLKGKLFPVVINFHGGGFTLGTAHDDCRWAGVVVDKVGAVVVSVDYRLAPEWPFPTAVEDGADAVLYLAQHAAELHLDPDRFALSGFSSGANMSFTVPLCLQGELQDRSPSGAKIEDSHVGQVPSQAGIPFGRPAISTPGASALSVNAPPSTSHSADNSSLKPPSALRPTLSSLTPTSSRLNLTPVPSNSAVPTLNRQKSRLDRIAMLRQTGTSSLSLVSSFKEGNAVSITTGGHCAKIRGIVSFYPPTDYTRTRESKRLQNVRADQNLPAVFTELFDESYLQPPSLDLGHPWLSPGKASTEMLTALPDEIVLFCCEWDMLLQEGEEFRDRLKVELGKKVRYHCVPGVPHGWDKAPNPLRESPGAREQYEVACKELRSMFGMEEDEDGHGGEMEDVEEVATHDFEHERRRVMSVVQEGEERERGSIA